MLSLVGERDVPCFADELQYVDKFVRYRGDVVGLLEVDSGRVAVKSLGVGSVLVILSKLTHMNFVLEVL